MKTWFCIKPDRRASSWSFAGWNGRTPASRFTAIPLRRPRPAPPRCGGNCTAPPSPNGGTMRRSLQGSTANCMLPASTPIETMLIPLRKLSRNSAALTLAIGFAGSCGCHRDQARVSLRGRRAQLAAHGLRCRARAAGNLPKAGCLSQLVVEAR